MARIGITMRFGRLLRPLWLAVVVAMAAPAAQAVTITFDSYVDGADLGAVDVATLEATQVGSDVEFVLTNTLTEKPKSFLVKLFLTYNGPTRGVSLLDVATVDARKLSIGNFSAAGLEFQFFIGYHVTSVQSGLHRLNPGESSTFRLLNTTLAGFFQSTDSALVEVRGLGKTTPVAWYQPSTIPLPSAGLMLLGALGGLALMRRLRRATA